MPEDASEVEAPDVSYQDTLDKLRSIKQTLESGEAEGIRAVRLLGRGLGLIKGNTETVQSDPEVFGITKYLLGELDRYTRDPNMGAFAKMVYGNSVLGSLRPKIQVALDG